MVKDLLAILSILLIVVYWAAVPIHNYGNGTSRDVSVDILSVPFIDDNRLTYRWSGEVFRRCDITIRRQLIDSYGIVETLAPRQFGSIPTSLLGDTSYIVSVVIPPTTPPGETVYQATEYSACNWVERLFPKGVLYPPVVFTVER